MKPLTQIVDGVERALYLLRSTKDQTVLRPRTVSNTLGDPVVNADADVEYLPILVEDVPQVDPVYQNVMSIEGFNDKTGAWQITYVVTDRTKEEILAAIDEEKRAKVQQVAPPEIFTESGILVLAAILRSGKFDFSPEEQADADAVTDRATKLLTNRQNSDGLKAEVDAGRKPDIKTGWEAAAITTDLVAETPGAKTKP